MVAMLVTSMWYLGLFLFVLPDCQAICGYNPRYDSKRLLAEQNTHYIAQFLDNTNDVDTEYRTKVSLAGTWFIALFNNI